MRENYKVPKHINKYVKVELYNYKKNKKLLKEMQDSKSLISSHTLLIVEQKISQIEAVFERLNDDQRYTAEVIFFKQYSQAQAELLAHISYDSYYWTMRKVIYLVAEEMNLI